MSLSLDNIWTVVILLVVVVSGVVGIMVSNEIATDVISDPTVDNTTKEVINEVNTSAPKIFDYAFGFVFILLWAAMLLLNYFLDNHPVFYVITVIMMIALFFVVAAVQDVYIEVTGDVDLAVYAAQMPIANFIMKNAVMVFLVMAMSVAFVLFAKVRGGQGR